MWGLSGLFATILSAAMSAGQPLLQLKDLTVPRSQLPDGCQLAPAPSVEEEPGRVRAGLWGGLPVPTNPWVGTNAPVAGKIRLRVEGAPRIVDAPLSRATLARQEIALAEDVEEAYAAFYTGPDRALTAVYAVKLKPSKGRLEGVLRQAPPMQLGPYLVVHAGPEDACHHAIVEHLTSLRR